MKRPHLEPRPKISRGAKLLANLVGVTYGPSGRNVLIQRFSGLIATKDGATVAREAGSPDPIVDATIRVIRDACLRVEERAGDGTTTTALLTSVIFHEAWKLVEGGQCPVELSRQLEEAAKRAVTFIEALTIPVHEEEILRQVGMIASKGDEEVARVVASAFMEVGDLGAIIVQDGHRVGIEVEHREGLVVDSGWAIAEYRDWCEPGQNKVTAEGALVAVFLEPVHSVEDIRSCLEVATQWPHNPLVIVAPRIQTSALETILINCLSRRDKRGNLPCQPIIPIHTREMHRDRADTILDIAAISDATVVDSHAGHQRTDFKAEWFGSCRYIDVSEKRSEFIAYQEPRFEEALEKRIKVLQRLEATTTSDYSRDKYRERIAALDGGLCLLKVSGHTDSASRERKSRIEDTLFSVRAAAKYGVVPGAGSSFLFAAQHLEPDTCGSRILKRALQEPARCIVANAGCSPALLTECHEAWFGFDADTQQVRDLMVSPVIVDSLPAVTESLLAAVSAAGMLLTTEVFVPKRGQV